MKELWDVEDEGLREIPFVIDNQQVTMSAVLNTLLTQYKGQSLDIATAYFNIGGWSLLREGLETMGTVRLLLGDEPEAGIDLGLREVGSRPVRGLIKDLSDASFNERTLRLVEDLTAFLRQEHVQVRLYTKGFLHAKSYLFYNGGGFARFEPIAAIVGSSNFTRAGLLLNKELNLVHRANLAPEEVAPERLKGLLEKAERTRLNELAQEQRTLAANVPGVLAISGLADWYERQWKLARDFKEDLIDLLDASKFGRKTYTPYQIYMKAMYEYFRDDLDESETQGVGRSAVDLSEFQEDAVKKARRLLARYSGVIIADSVGLGKTWIGKKLLEDYAYHQRYRAVVICPAALQKMWHDELMRSGIAATIVTQEVLGRDSYDIRDVQDADVVLVDESHNFRNRNTQRYENLERLLAANNRRGTRSNERKKVILLTATPINNSVFDLYNQINLITGGDRTYFTAAGIGDLQRYFLAARRVKAQTESSIVLFNVLEEIVIRRTRPFIKEAYPDAAIQGKPIHWPERRLRTVRYDLETTYSGIYERLVSRIEGLTLAPYRLEFYKKQGIQRDQFEEGREDALVGIFKSRYLKRFESSIDAFRISIRRALEFLETFESYVLDNKVLDSASFQKALRFLAREDEEDDVTPATPNTPSTPGSRSDELDAKEEARAFLDTLPVLDSTRYDLKRLHNDLRRDVNALRAIWHDIESLTADRDDKLTTLKTLLAGDLRGQKVLIFTSYKDTARYLYRQLCSDEEWLNAAGNPVIRRMDSGTDTKERARLVTLFAPRANHRDDLAGSEQEIDIMISTDVLSEGQNLQDCGVLINYDLHWNPTRMVQRAGRIDRIGTSFESLWILNMFPEDGLEKLLGLVESLSLKIADIDRNGLLDSSILGEVVHPQNFNTLRRIAEEDETVVAEQEQVLELVSSEYLLQNLKNLLNTGMREELEQLPDGIHSGMVRAGAKGVFFYFATREKGKNGKLHETDETHKSRRHYWRYIELDEQKQGRHIEENRYIITNLIQCQPDMPRVVPIEGNIDIFTLQEQVIASIVRSAATQVAVAEAPSLLDPIQQTISTTLRAAIHSPGMSRKDILAAIQRLNTPQPNVYVKALRKAYDAYLVNQQIAALLESVKQLGANGDTNERGEIGAESKEKPSLLKRDDLKLICFEYIWH